MSANRLEARPSSFPYSIQVRPWHVSSSAKLCIGLGCNYTLHFGALRIIMMAIPHWSVYGDDELFPGLYCKCRRSVVDSDVNVTVSSRVLRQNFQLLYSSLTFNIKFRFLSTCHQRFIFLWNLGVKLGKKTSFYESRLLSMDEQTHR